MRASTCSSSGETSEGTFWRPSIFQGRVFKVLLLAMAVASAGYARAAISPLQEAIRAGLALSDNQMALLQGPAMAVPSALIAIPLGLVIDRYSRVRLLLVFGMLNVVGNVLTGLTADFAMLFGVRCLVGLVASATFPATLSLVADVCPSSHRGRATMALAIGEVGGVSVAFALGGALLGAFSSQPSGWRWAAVWLSAPLALVMVVFLAMREPPRTGQFNPKPSVWAAWPELWRYRRVIAPLVAGKIMVGTAYGAALIWTAPTLSRTFLLPPERIGSIMAVGLMVSGIVGPLIGGTLADFCQRTGGPRRTMAVISGLALLSVPASFFAVMPTVTLASALLTLLMTLILVIGVTEMTLSTVVIPNELRGLSLSLLIAAGLIFGTGLAPLAVSMLSGAIGGSAMIGHALTWVCLATGVLGAATFALGSRYFPRAVLE